MSMNLRLVASYATLRGIFATSQWLFNYSEKEMCPESEQQLQGRWWGQARKINSNEREPSNRGCDRMCVGKGGFFLEAVARSQYCWMSVITLEKFHFNHTYRWQQCRVSLCNGKLRKGYVNWTMRHWEQRCLTVNCATCWSIYPKVLMSPNRREKIPMQNQRN